MKANNSGIKKSVMGCVILLMFGVAAFAQTNEPMPLWPDGAPGATGKTEKDIPTLTAFFPEAGNATGAALVICPGGGYGGLAPSEGQEYAKWLTHESITCFVLKYRLGSAGYRHPIELMDAARALRTVRAGADKWKLDPKRIGIMGSSAGGHLASTLLTHFEPGKADATDPIEQVSSRPDIGILCYPVITMGEKTHQGSKKNLLGTNPPPELIELLSNEKHVTKDTPPTFIFHTAEDKVVPVENSLMFAMALANEHVPFDLHIFEKGPHGGGLGGSFHSKYDPAKMHPWTADCLFWLKQQGWLTSAKTAATATPAASTATAAEITGTITLSGTPPEEKVNDQIAANADCSKLHSEPVKTQFYVVGANKGLKDVVVIIKGITGKSKGDSATPLVLDQKGCEYMPYIAAVQTGQKIVIKNSDPLFHNVDVIPTSEGNASKAKNAAQGPGAPDVTISFPAAESFLRFKCDVHPWMFAYVTVVDSPYFSVSDKDGHFKISDLPPGKYTIEAAHRRAGKVTKEIEVKDGGNTVDLTMEVSK